MSLLQNGRKLRCRRFATINWPLVTRALGLPLNGHAAAERLYGYTETEALRAYIRQLVAGEDHEKLNNMLAELRGGKKLAPLET